MSETAVAPAAPSVAAVLDGGAPAAPAAAPTTPAAPTAPEWLGTLPDALKADPVLSRYKTVEDLAKGHVEAQGLIGRKGLIAPKEGDAPEVTAAWRTALGVPENPDGYEIKPAEGVAPEHWSDDTAGVLKSWAHELGLTPAQAQGLAERYTGLLAGAGAEEAEKTESTLREEWGAAYDRKVNAGMKAAAEFLTPEARSALKAAGLATNPHIIRALVGIGEKIGGHDGAAGMSAGGSGPLTPAEARAKAAEIRAHPGYFDNRHPEHKHLVARAVDLEKMATVRA